MKPKTKDVEVPDSEQENDREGQIIGDTSDETKSKPFGSIKPEFNRQQQCVIETAKFQSNGETITTDKKKGELPEEEQYKRHWLNVKFKYKENGGDKFFNQTYGSVREYKDRLWMGQACNLAELKQTLEAFNSVPLEGIWEMEAELVGKTCLVKSVPYEVGNNKGISNKVMDFVEPKEDK